MAKIADHTASQQTIGVTSLTFRGHVKHRSRDHVIPIGHFLGHWWSCGTKPLSLTVSEIFNVECDAMVMVDMTLSE